MIAPSGSLKMGKEPPIKINQGYYVCVSWGNPYTHPNAQAVSAKSPPVLKDIDVLHLETQI